MPPKVKTSGAAKPRSSAAPKPKPKTKPIAKPTPSSKKKTESPPPSPCQRPFLDKSLVLRILLAKLQASKKCDWYELSLKLNAEDDGGGGKEAAGGKGSGGKGGKAAKDKVKKGKGKKGGISGADLHDLYHNQILPGLQSGRALWMEEAETKNMNIPDLMTGSQLIAEEVDMFATPNAKDDVNKAGNRPARNATNPKFAADKKGVGVQHEEEDYENEEGQEGEDDDDEQAGDEGYWLNGLWHDRPPENLVNKPANRHHGESENEVDPHAENDEDDDSGTSVDSDYDL